MDQSMSVWMSEHNLEEAVLSFYTVGPRDHSQAVRLAASTFRYLLKHRRDPQALASFKGNKEKGKKKQKPLGSAFSLDTDFVSASRCVVCDLKYFLNKDHTVFLIGRLKESIKVIIKMGTGCEGDKITTFKCNSHRLANTGTMQGSVAAHCSIGLYSTNALLT